MCNCYIFSRSRDAPWITIISEDNHEPRVSRSRLPSEKKTPRSHLSPRSSQSRGVNASNCMCRDLAYRQTKYILSSAQASHVIWASWPPVTLWWQFHIENVIAISCKMAAYLFNLQCLDSKRKKELLKNNIKSLKLPRFNYGCQHFLILKYANVMRWILLKQVVKTIAICIIILGP